MERYVEALKDPKTGLSYPALVGMRKQSVQDAEIMFSIPLAEYMMEGGYVKEAEYIRVVNGWRRATDERGLSSLKRCELNYRFLSYILDDLMPWHRENYDFSTMEVNRYVSWYIYMHVLYRLATRCMRGPGSMSVRFCCLLNPLPHPFL